MTKHTKNVHHNFTDIERKIKTQQNLVRDVHHFIDIWLKH